nr:709_t:CDS:2 [Entrophospora candida]
MVDEFVENFNNMDTPNYIRNVIHNKSWKENEVELLKMTEWILGVLFRRDIWCNLAFGTSMACSMQSEGTYITDAIMPLLHASLGDIPNGYICLSSAERQSLASKARRNDGTDKEKMGKNPILWP